MKRLHITGDERTAARVREAGAEGDVLPWRDTLCQGPVPAGLSLDEMTRVRARYLSSAPWASRDDESYEGLLDVLRRRDTTLAGFRRLEEVVLWFRGDLCDQLRLLQLLHWFAKRPASGPRLVLVSPDDGFDGADGRGEEVDAALRERGRRAWDAYCADDPTALQEIAAEGDAAPLPSVAAAFGRHLEQFPSTRDGLARSDRQLLSLLAGGPRSLREAFEESQVAAEERPFMTERGFLLRLGGLARPEPLVRIPSGGSPAPWDATLQLTDAGGRVVAGQADRSRFQEYDDWLGGVHLVGREVPWRWNPRRGRLEAQRER